MQPRVITLPGAVGEERVGTRLDRLQSQGCVVLHDRGVPDSRAIIDRIVVAPSAVWVIDRKRYHGRVAQRDVGRWFRIDERLYVGERDCSRLVDRMAKQVSAVRRALNPIAPRIRPALCFTRAEWSGFANPLDVGGVIVTWPDALLRAIGGAPASRIDVELVAAHLAARLPVAHRTRRRAAPPPRSL
jgi:Nuclease-related domain